MKKQLGFVLVYLNILSWGSAFAALWLTVFSILKSGPAIAIMVYGFIIGLISVSLLTNQAKGS